MIVLLYSIVLLAFFYANYYKSSKTLHMLQENLYNENNRYFKWMIKNKKDFISLDIVVIGISLIGILVISNIEPISYLCMILVTLFLILIGYSWNKKIGNDQNKKKLVVTPRIRRLIATASIILLIPVMILAFNIENVRVTWLVFLIEAIALYLNRIFFLIVMWINTPIEKAIYVHFKKKALAKIKSMPNLKIIGITGSYGKTSSKNILGEILNVK